MSENKGMNKDESRSDCRSGDLKERWAALRQNREVVKRMPQWKLDAHESLRPRAHGHTRSTEEAPRTAPPSSKDVRRDC